MGSFFHFAPPLMTDSDSDEKLLFPYSGARARLTQKSARCRGESRISHWKIDKKIFAATIFS
jgi:hypothetical protein